MKKRCTALACLLMAQTAIAGDFNPFLGPGGKAPAVQKSSSTRKTSSTQNNLGALPPPLPPVAPGSYPQTTPPSVGGRGETAKAEKSMKAVGRIGDQVTVIDQNGESFVVQDGATKDGCFVMYPNVTCDQTEIATAKKAFARERASEEAAIAAQQTKIDELQETTIRLRQEIKKITDDVAQLTSTPTKQSASTASPASKEAPTKVIDGDHISEELVKTRDKAARLEVEMEALKVAANTAPEWVKGSPKTYRDRVLGSVSVSRHQDQIYFKVINSKEIKADAFFGRNILKKERRGEFTYYALFSKNVKVKE